MVTAAVVATLLITGDQVPAMLLLEVVASGGMLAPLQYGPTWVKVGVVLLLTVMVAACEVIGLAQAPTLTLAML